jgi:hypothetical protein
MPKVSKVEREVLSIGRVLFESLLLIVSVVLGFVVSEWGTHAKERELAANVRRSIAQEVEDNLRTMDAQLDRHRAGLAALVRAKPDPAKPALLVLVTSLPGGTINNLPMKRAAWDAAVSSGALRLLDHDLVERYSEIYVDQERVYDDDTNWMKSALYRPENFDPQQQKVALATLRGVLAELRGNEYYMCRLYRGQLPALRKAAGLPPPTGPAARCKLIGD